MEASTRTVRPEKRPKIWMEASKRPVRPEKRPKIWMEASKRQVRPEKRPIIWTGASKRPVHPEKRPKNWTGKELRREMTIFVIKLITYMKKVILLTLAVAVLAACQSPQQKAEKRAQTILKQLTIPRRWSALG